MSNLKPVDYVLEATSAEYQLLWEKYNKDEKFQNWTSENIAHNTAIGIIGDRNICLQYRYVSINGKTILVWTLTSSLADYNMAEKWLNDNCAAYKIGNFCDAMNFCHILT